MNQKALNALEYPKIIEKLTDKASSYMGKQLCSLPLIWKQSA